MKDIKYLEKVRKRMNERIEEQPEKSHVFVSLRLPIEMVGEIDKQVKTRAGFKRTTWILQAIQKQLGGECEK